MENAKLVVLAISKNSKILFISSLTISQKSKKYKKAGFILKFFYVTINYYKTVIYVILEDDLQVKMGKKQGKKIRGVEKFPKKKIVCKMRCKYLFLRCKVQVQVYMYIYILALAPCTIDKMLIISKLFFLFF